MYNTYRGYYYCILFYVIEGMMMIIWVRAHKSWQGCPQFAGAIKDEGAINSCSWYILCSITAVVLIKKWILYLYCSIHWKSWETFFLDSFFFTMTLTVQLFSTKIWYTQRNVSQYEEWGDTSTEICFTLETSSSRWRYFPNRLSESIPSEQTHSKWIPAEDRKLSLQNWIISYIYS